MTTTKKPVKKMQTGGKATKKPTILKPDYRNFKLARSNNNRVTGQTGDTKATKQDSTNYKEGFIKGVRGWKPSANRLKYQGEGEYEKMGRWEGQNMKKESLSKKKTGGKLSKARNGKPVKKAFLGSLLGGAGGGAGGSMLGGMGKQMLGGLASKALGGLMGGGAGGGRAAAQGGQGGGAQAPMQRRSTDMTPVRTKRMMKKGGKVSKAKSGTSLGMKSVKAGFDKNPGITRADIITAATKKAKSGAKMKMGGKMTKCKDGCK